MFGCLSVYVIRVLSLWVYVSLYEWYVNEDMQVCINECVREHVCVSVSGWAYMSVQVSR